MKVLYVTHSPGLQGAGIALLNIIKGVLNMGVEPVVVLPYEGPLVDKLQEIGVKCHLVMCYNTIYPRRKYLYDYPLYPYRLIRTLVTNHRAIERFRKIVKEEKPDVIHTNSGVVRFAAQVAKEERIPHVWHVREFQSKDFLWVPLGGEKRVLELYKDHNNHCVAITKSVFDHFHLNSEKDCVIYDGVFPKDIVTPQCTKKEKRFLFVGSLQKGKGIFDALEAFDSIAGKYPDYELWIAGKDYVNIEKLIANCKHSSLIKYLGFRTDIYQLMADSTALLVPSYYEGFGFITAEAMLNKTLVIGRNVAGTKEQFENGFQLHKKPIALSFNDMASFTYILDDICKSDSRKYDDYIERAYTTVHNFYTIEKSCNDLIKIYESIIY